MILETATQRDADWYAARIGKATASRFKDAMATKKQTEKQKRTTCPATPCRRNWTISPNWSLSA